MFPAAFFPKAFFPGTYFPPQAGGRVDEEPAALWLLVAREPWISSVPIEPWIFSVGGEPWQFEASEASMVGVTDKDPSAVSIHTISWAAWLAERSADTISSSTWTVPTGITKVAQSNTTTTATVKLSGGTLLAFYDVVNTIVTAGGRTEQRTLRVRMVEK